MHEKVIDYSSGGRRTSRRYRVGRRGLFWLLAPALLFGAWVAHEAWFSCWTRASYLQGKTVAQVVRALGKPDEDLRDSDDAALAAATATSPANPLHHTYGPNERFNGDFVYIDHLGNRFCRIAIRNGIATQVVHTIDMK